MRSDRREGLQRDGGVAEVDGVPRQVVLVRGERQADAGVFAVQQRVGAHPLGHLPQRRSRRIHLEAGELAVIIVVLDGADGDSEGLNFFVGVPAKC